MNVQQVLASEDPVAAAAALLLEHSRLELRPEEARFEALLYFYGRIYGGGLSHAIAAAPEGAIQEAFRLVRTYGSTQLVGWAHRLQAYFQGIGVLFGPKSARQQWEALYSDSPDPAFEQLHWEAHEIEDELGRVLCKFLREQPDAFHIPPS